MRKRLVTPIPHDRVAFDQGGLDVASLGMVEIWLPSSGNNPETTSYRRLQCLW
jgi:hypothetical protein